MSRFLNNIHGVVSTFTNSVYYFVKGLTQVQFNILLFSFIGLLLILIIKIISLKNKN